MRRSVCFRSHVSVCNTITVESLDLEKVHFGMRVHLQNGQFRFVYEGHRVKVKVTKSMKCDPATPRLQWQRDCNCSDGKSISVIQGNRGQAALGDRRLTGHRVVAYAQAFANWSRWMLAVAELRVHNVVYITIQWNGGGRPRVAT